jgi:hypothetical protein
VPFVVHSSHVETMTLALNLWSWWDFFSSYNF